MLILDLKWIVFLLLLAAAAALVAGSRFPLSRGRRRSRAAAGLGEVMGAFDGSPIGVAALQEGRRYAYANPAARRLLSLEKATGHLPETPWAELLLADCRAARLEGPTAGRYRSVALDTDAMPGGSGESAGRFVDWWVTGLRDVDLVFLLDVTAQRRAEGAARTLLNDLSHELRTPLATILTHLEVLSLPAVPGEASQQSVALLRAEARRMARLVHQMLELGRLETSADVERRPLDLLALAEKTIAQVTPQATERQIRLTLEADTPLPLALGDADRLRQAFLNLLDNAIKYSRPGDRVVVSLRKGEAGIHCQVCDSGPGIPAAHLPHITRRFYRAAPQSLEGSGLGLALVAEILRRHGSALEVRSQTEGDDTGTCARFVVPMDAAG